MLKCATPNGDFDLIRIHKVTGYEDGTITVFPSLVFHKDNATEGWQRLSGARNLGIGVNDVIYKNVKMKVASWTNCTEVGLMFAVLHSRLSL
jgi:hypothetical protein